jgi:hypothetical protein
VERFWDCGQFNMTVTDEEGLTLFSLFLTGVEAPAIRIEPTVST